MVQMYQSPAKLFGSMDQGYQPLINQPKFEFWCKCHIFFLVGFFSLIALRALLFSFHVSNSNLNLLASTNWPL